MENEEIVDLIMKTGCALARYITELEAANFPKSHRQEVIDSCMKLWKQIYEVYLTDGKS